MRRIQKPLAIVTFLVYMLAMVWLVRFKVGTGLYEVLRFGLPDLPRGIAVSITHATTSGVISSKKASKSLKNGPIIVFARYPFKYFASLNIFNLFYKGILS